LTKYEGFYKCKWPGCNCEFVATFGVVDKTKGGCSAVKCPKCHHNLKPKLDATTIKEIKEKNVVVK